MFSTLMDRHDIDNDKFYFYIYNAHFPRSQLVFVFRSYAKLCAIKSGRKRGYLRLADCALLSTPFCHIVCRAV